jgi:hypothetical protein
MKKYSGVIILICTLMLSGCAGPKPTTVKAIDGSSVAISGTFAPPDLNNNNYADTKLRIVSPAHLASGMGLKVLTAVLGGSVSSQGFDKEGYKGRSIDSMPEPTKTYFLPKAEARITKWLSENGKGHQYDQPLYIAAARWALIYKDLSAQNSDYELHYRVIFYKRPEGGNAFSAFIIADCSPVKEAAPFSEWEASNYAKVTQVTQQYMDACLLELDNQLPRLLKK